MSISESLVEIKTYAEPNYKSLIFYEGWRIAFLNNHERICRENIFEMERHNETDEVFVLLKGSAALYIGDGSSQTSGTITTIPLQPYTIYNVKKKVWHSVETSPDTSILIIENADTSLENSQKIPITPDMLPVWNHNFEAPIL